MKFTRHPAFAIEEGQKIGPFCEMRHTIPTGNASPEQHRIVEDELKSCGSDYRLLFRAYDICYENVRSEGGTASRPVLAVSERGLVGEPAFSPFIVLKAGAIISRNKAGEVTAHVDIEPAIVDGCVVRRSERNAPDLIEYLVLTRSVGRGGWTPNWTNGAVLEGTIVENEPLAGTLHAA
jgi:hypothetical protein